MNRRFIEIIQAARQNGVNPVNALMDYMTEKDSRITRAQAARLVERTEEAWRESNTFETDESIGRSRTETGS